MLALYTLQEAGFLGC